MTVKKVAFITGVARGQGRAHAVKLASKGMNIIGLDICADIPSMDYPNATEDDLRATVKLVEAAPVTGGLRFELAGDSPSGRAARGPARPQKGRVKPRFKPKKR